jgi:hypothetical protein
MRQEFLAFRTSSSRFRIFNHWLETDEFNNLAWVKFSLSRQGGNPKITILEQSACTAVTCGSPSNP